MSLSLPVIRSTRIVSLSRGGQAGHPRAPLSTRGFRGGIRCRTGCRGGEQVGVDAQEVGDRGQGGVERTEPGRDRWFGFVVGELFGLQAAEPAEVEQPQVTGGEGGTVLVRVGQPRSWWIPSPPAGRRPATYRHLTVIGLVPP